MGTDSTGGTTPINEQPEVVENPSGEVTEPLSQMAVRIPNSLKFRAKMFALREQVTLADVVVKALDGFLKHDPAATTFAKHDPR